MLAKFVWLWHGRNCQIQNSPMSFSQKIYYFDKPLILTDDSQEYVDANPGAEQYGFFAGATLKSFTQALQQLERPGIPGAIVEDGSLDSLLDQLQAMYRPIEAAGGLVVNEKGEVLMIYRRGKWDLPKGKLDEGEDIETCCVREVSEETGLQQLKLGDKLCETFHAYTQFGENQLKRTTWFRLAGSSADKLKPQKEEDILEARWVGEGDVPPLAAKSYEAVRDVLRVAGMLN
jgi:8-oxo-dGTP pyrophosphatase MutT (NUDIX family)